MRATLFMYRVSLETVVLHTELNRLTEHMKELCVKSINNVLHTL